MFISSKFLTLCALISAATSLPSVPVLTSIPSNAAKIAHDAKLDIIIAYDAAGHLLGQLPAHLGLPAMNKRDAGSCVNMSPNDIQQLPGWNTLAQYISDNWGSDYDTLDANPSDYPDMGAQLCVSGDTTPINLDGEPTCTTQSQSTGGTLAGADGSIALAATQGTSQSTQVTVTQQSSLAVGASVAVKVSVPEIAEVTATLTSTLTFTNTLSTATTFTTNDQQTQTVTVQAKSGQNCQLNFNSTSCDFTGTGSVRMVATGWAWVYYGNRRDGHYKWAASLDSVLTNEDDRATDINFSSSTSSNTASQYSALCQ